MKSTLFVTVVIAFINLLSPNSADAGRGNRGGTWGDEKYALSLPLAQAISLAAQLHSETCNASELSEMVLSLLVSDTTNQASVNDVSQERGSQVDMQTLQQTQPQMQSQNHQTTQLPAQSLTCLGLSLDSLVDGKSITPDLAKQIKALFN